jgi:hypothetical protein
LAQKDMGSLSSDVVCAHLSDHPHSLFQVRERFFVGVKFRINHVGRNYEDGVEY